MTKSKEVLLPGIAATSKGEAMPGTGNVCTPATRGDGKYTQKDAQIVHSYSSSLFSNLSPHLIALNHLS